MSDSVSESVSKVERVKYRDATHLKTQNLIHLRIEKNFDANLPERMVDPEIVEGQLRELGLHTLQRYSYDR